MQYTWNSIDINKNLGENVVLFEGDTMTVSDTEQVRVMSQELLCYPIKSSQPTTPVCCQFFMVGGIAYLG